MTENDLLESHLPSLTEPLLIVWGADDHLTPLTCGPTDASPRSPL